MLLSLSIGTAFFIFFCMPIDKNDPSFKLSPSQNMSSGGPLSPVIAKFLTCPAQFISVPPSISSKPHLRSQVPPLYLSGIYLSCLNQHKNSKPFSIKIGSITIQTNPDFAISNNRFQLIKTSLRTRGFLERKSHEYPLKFCQHIKSSITNCA